MLQPEEALRVLKRRGLDPLVVEPAEAQRISGLEGVEAPDFPSGSIAVAVPDHTRPLPLHRVLEGLRPILDRSLIIFATGTHPMPPDEARRLLGPWASRVKFKIHDCRSTHTPVGTTGRGLPVEVDCDFASADHRVTIGLVAPHPWAGFSGGSKLVLPGVSSLTTIVEHHLRWYRYGRPAVVEGNLFREEIEEAGRLARVDWSLNVVLGASGEVVFAGAGDPRASFTSCVRVAERIYVRDVEGVFDAALVFADPLDGDLYQATKALEHAAPAVTEGGEVVLVAECRLGYGSPEFERFVGMSREELLECVRRGLASNLVPAVIALKLWEIAETRRVTLLTAARLRVPGVALAEDPLAALERLRGRVLVVKQGGFTVPRVVNHL